MRLGGWWAAKAALALVAGLTAGLTTWLAMRRLSIGGAAAGVGVGAAFVGIPLAAYGVQVYPEMPAALAVVGAVALLTAPTPIVAPPGRRVRGDRGPALAGREVRAGGRRARRRAAAGVPAPAPPARRRRRRRSPSPARCTSSPTGSGTAAGPSTPPATTSPTPASSPSSGPGSTCSAGPGGSSACSSTRTSASPPGRRCGCWRRSVSGSWRCATGPVAGSSWRRSPPAGSTPRSWR